MTHALPKVSLLLALAILWSAAALGAQTPSEAEKLTRLKAAFLLNFIKFSEWPVARWADEQSPIVIGVLGSDTIADVLHLAVYDQRLHDRPVVVVRLRYPAPAPRDPGNPRERQRHQEELEDFHHQVRRLHALYIDESHREHVPALLQQMDRAAVLTVSDAPEFTAAGGMLGLVIRENRMTFDANVQAIHQAGLNVSSKVLRLARVLRPREK